MHLPDHLGGIASGLRIEIVDAEGENLQARGLPGIAVPKEGGKGLREVLFLRSMSQRLWMVIWGTTR